MGIIIEHMEMPNGCCECRMQTENCCTLSLRKIDDIFTRPAWCKLKETKHGRWVKMSDTDGIYYACSECANELPRVINSFNPQFDLFPKLKCIDKTAYCPSCGAKMNGGENEN